MDQITPQPSQPASYAGQPVASAPVITTKEWIITFLLLAIPLVGLVMLFVWAFSETENPTKRNWARGQLIWTAIIVGLMVVFYAFLFLVIGIGAATAGAGGSFPPAPAP